MNLNAVILEDEIASRSILTQIIQETNPDVSIIGSFEIPEKAKEYLLDNHDKVDIIFLDIQLPNQNGIEFIQSLPFIPKFEIIFSTAYQEYMEVALNDFSAIYYLLKPYTNKKVQDAIEKVIRKKQGLPTQAFLLDNFSKQKDYENGYSWFLKDVLYFEADGYITHIYLNNKKKISVSKNLSYFEEKYTNLASDIFVRCSRKYLINKNYVSSFAIESTLIQGKIFGGKLTMTDRLKIGVPYPRLSILKNFLADKLDVHQ